MGAKVTFNPATKIIEVTQVPTLEGGELVVNLDIKTDVYSDGKEDWLSSSTLSKFRFPLRTVGGDALPGGKSLGSTFFLDSDWKIRPYESSHRLKVNGNLYSEDGSSPFVQTIGSYNVFFELTVSNLVDSVQRELPEVTQLKYMIESKLLSHQGFGHQFFVDPVNGDDLLDGTTPETAKETISSALSLVTAGHGDVIYIVSDSTEVLITENIVLNKKATHIRSQGRSITWQPSSGVALTVDADNCSVYGLFIKAPVASSSDCIVVNGKYCLISDTFIVGAGQLVGTGRGIVINGGDYHRLHNVEIEKCGGSGLYITDAGIASGSPREITVNGTNFYLNGGSGIEMVALAGSPYSSTRFNRLYNCILVNNLQYGIKIGSNVSGTYIAETCCAKNNTIGNTLDSGSETHMNSTAKKVWEHPVGSEIAGTTGKTLKDIKTFSTVAMAK